MFQTKHFLRASPAQFLCLTDSKPACPESQVSIELLTADMDRFRTLKAGEEKLIAALKLFSKRGNDT